jgi:hypothetical protein
MLVIDEHSLSILIEESERLVFIAEEEVSTAIRIEARRAETLGSVHDSLLIAQRLFCALTQGIISVLNMGGERERGATIGDNMSNITQRKLTRKQTALVEAYVANGGNLTQASQEAGYAQGDSGRVTAQKSMKLAHVQQYMMEVVAKEFSRHAPAAVHQLAGLAKQAKSEYVQLEASKDLLDRAGFKPIDRSQVQLAGDIKVSIDLG